MKKSPRTNLLPAPKLQGALLCRVLLYWLACVLVMLALAGVQAALSGGEAGFGVLLNRSLLAFGPALLSSLLVLPLLLIDALRFSVRFAGPLRRLTGEAHRMASGEDIAAIHFRRGDYWHELAVQFNAVASELKRLRAADQAATEPSASEADRGPTAAGV